MSSTFIAFDFGMTKMGVAIGQNITNTASPLDPMTMKNGTPDWDLLEQLIKEYRPTKIILGKPKVINESSEALMKKIKAFKRSLERDLNQNVEWTPEHLTSKDAKEKLKVRRQEGILSRKIMKGQIDSMAATIFLQDWMNQR
ncbi:MAG: Holliday junction resolvase RuvX [Gammaproteobacteria bacterium]|nr:Holliday junction resolvase RuvX [Gammaproteobacteria bacterium]OUT95168.1 MAG: Holliday junction resolvase RuvX [Gammaproteobacteria bacterium TMED36]|tara:strand:- start:1761 stop:2186 length:426 start_codon:yes stop_codon:yes gene_type:complete